MSKYFDWGNDWDSWKETASSNKEWRGEKILPRKKELLFLHTYYIHDWYNESKDLFNRFRTYKRKLENEENVNGKSF